MSFFSKELREAEDRGIELTSENMLDFLGLVDMLRSSIRQFNPIFKHIISDPVSIVVRSDISSPFYLFTPAWTTRST